MNKQKIWKLYTHIHSLSLSHTHTHTHTHTHITTVYGCHYLNGGFVADKMLYNLESAQ